MKLSTPLCACFAIFIFGGCAVKSHQEGPITLADIVNDVEAHGVNSKYKGQKVTITAAGRIYPSADADPPRLELFSCFIFFFYFLSTPCTRHGLRSKTRLSLHRFQMLMFDNYH